MNTLKSEKSENNSKSEGISIPKEIEQIISDTEIPKEKKQVIIKAFLESISIRESFSGPIPPPEILMGYNNVVNNGAERIISMAEKQLDHRIQLEKNAIGEELKQSRYGQIFGFILGLIGMGLASLLALFGHEAIAGIFGTTTIIGLVTVFVLGKKSQTKNLEEKNN